MAMHRAGEIICDWLEANDRSQSWLGRKVNVSQATVYRWAHEGMVADEVRANVLAKITGDRRLRAGSRAWKQSATT